MTALDRHPGFADELKKKFPKHLIYSKGGNNKMTDKGFYMFNIERSNKKLFLILVLVIAVVFAFLLFQIWPMWLKIGLWYFSFYSLVFLVRLPYQLLI